MPLHQVNTVWRQGLWRALQRAAVSFGLPVADQILPAKGRQPHDKSCATFTRVRPLAALT
jgi:hypothetical protein